MNNHPDTVQAHPLSVAMGSGWHWLYEVCNANYTLLHTSGLWFLMDGGFLDDTANGSEPAVIAAIAETVLAALEAGQVGQHQLAILERDGELSILFSPKS